MKLEGKLMGIDIVVLIDSGASHNFISPQLTVALGLKVQETRKLGIKLGDGHKVFTKGKCPELYILLGTFELKTEAYVLELVGVDVVLGVYWLKTLGKVVMDWEEMTMQFHHEDLLITLQGKLEAAKKSKQTYKRGAKSCSLYCLLQGYSLTIDGFLWEGVPSQTTLPLESELNASQQLELSQLLERFSAVFTEGSRLPPKQSQQHAIVLQEGQNPISVRPYRYPYHQKEEIERQVQEILQSGVIRPSRSGYEVYLLEAPYKDPMGCAARNVHGFTLEDTRKMAEKWEESPPLYMQIDIQSLFHGDDLNEQSIQEVDMDITDSDCDNNKAKLLEESLKSPEPKRENFVHRQDSSKHVEKWEFDEEEEWQTRIKELGSSKWSKDLDEEDKKLEGVGKNINALSGLIHAYSKGGKSVHWGDQLNKSGFSIGTVKKHSLIIGPGSGYNLASNPVGETQDITEAAKTSNTNESKRRFSEKLRAEHESIRTLLSKRRQRIGGFFNTEDG